MTIFSTGPDVMVNEMQTGTGSPAYRPRKLPAAMQRFPSAVSAF